MMDEKILRLKIKEWEEAEPIHSEEYHQGYIDGMKSVLEEGE